MSEGWPRWLRLMRLGVIPDFRKVKVLNRRPNEDILLRETLRRIDLE